MTPEGDVGPKARLGCRAKELGCYDREIPHGQQQGQKGTA